MPEAKVSKHSLPSGYSFVPKGNVFITSNCRKLTQELDRRVYIVIDEKKHQAGLGVPTEVYVGVQFKEMETRAKRAANVLKRDQGMAKTFQKEILGTFPQIPPKSLQNVVKIALEKGKGKVGRTGRLSMRRKVHLAVWAHVRHCETDYDVLLRSGVPREWARKGVQEKIREICKAWGGGSRAKHASSHKKSKPRERGNTAAPQGTKRVTRGRAAESNKDVEASNSTTKTAGPAKPNIPKEAGQSTSEQNAAVGRVRREYRAYRSHRAHRQEGSPEALKKETRTRAKQLKTRPNTSAAEVMATAASFREGRTRKETVLESIAPTPPRRAEETRANSSIPNLDPESRAQILRLMARIDRVERRSGRREQRQRHTTQLCTIASLGNQVNGILAAASIPTVANSKSARHDLANRLRRKVRAARAGSS